MALKKEDLFKQAVTEMTGRQSKPLPAFRRSIGDDPDQSMVDEAGTFAYPDFGRSPIIGVFWPETI